MEITEVCIGIVSPYQIWDWYGGCRTASGATDVEIFECQHTKIQCTKYCCIECNCKIDSTESNQNLFSWIGMLYYSETRSPKEWIL